jgi:hypothetical protein
MHRIIEKIGLNPQLMNQTEEKWRIAMNTRDYYELFRYLMEEHNLSQEDILFVDDISEWCAEKGIPETDAERPFKIILTKLPECKMLIREYLPEGVVEERINALRLRNQLKNVAYDRADMLNSVQKKLAFLFLKEYTTSVPDLAGDELGADDWVFDEMEGLGFFKT